MVQKIKISCFINFCLSKILVFLKKRTKNSYFWTGFSGPSRPGPKCLSPGLKNLGPTRPEPGPARAGPGFSGRLRPVATLVEN